MHKQNPRPKSPLLILAGIALCAGLVFSGVKVYNIGFTPVRGYGQLEFGMQGDAVSALSADSNVCDALTPVVTASAGSSRIYSRSCLGLHYGEGKRNATFTYIDNRLQSISINLYGADVDGTLQALTQKYGQPDSAPTELEKKQVDDHLTSAPVKWSFKQGQVMVQLQPGLGENDPATAVLRFASQGLEKQLSDAQQ